MKKLFGHFILLLLGALPNSAAQAQQGAIGDEHRYAFTIDASLSTRQEKLMLESFMNLDPEMHVSIERGERLMKILAYRPLDPQEFVRLAASSGVVVQPGRPRTALDPNLSEH